MSWRKGKEAGYSGTNLPPLQPLHRPHQLIAQTDGVSLRTEHNAVERIGNDENRQPCAGTELHFLPDSGFYASIRINSESLPKNGLAPVRF